MSILIKGMEMPRSCDECRIMVFEDTNCVPELFCGCPIVFKAHPQGKDYRPDYCPLIPAADVREVKRGRWSFDNIIFTDADGVSRSGMRGYKCSECGGFCIGESNFCPNCGADMRRES